ncbi:hypothetical protein [Spirosoma areae]
MNKFIPPIFQSSSFHCPHCGVLAEQIWGYAIDCTYKLKSPNGVTLGNSSYNLPSTQVAKCSHCTQASIWIDGNMVYPLTGSVEMANPDLPEDIKNDYNEAKETV